ncbi:MAG: hypothetical protein NVSMB56_03720 [Pyrinomonadaceae bacterium]
MKNISLKTRFLLICATGAALLIVGVAVFQRNSLAKNDTVRPTAVRPVLVSEANSTRAIALESVTRVKEPFALDAPVAFSADRRTRVTIFAMNLGASADAAQMTADAEDAAHRVYPLAVESVSVVPGQDWINSIVLRLNDDMTDVGDVLVRLSYFGAQSNRVRVGIGHIGGGLPDDVGAIPTPGTPVLPFAAPTPNTNPITAGILTADDVRTIIAQGVSAAASINRPVTIAVTDREGNILGIFRMTGAPTTTTIRGGGNGGLEGATVPSELAAISKAGTSALFSTQGNAFTTRTASFIIQEHIPAGLDNRPSGPLYGVQFSSLPCSDLKRTIPANNNQLLNLPLGLAGDPGSYPIYKNGVASGGVGVEGDGIYTVDRDPRDFDQPFEELIAVSATRGFDTPALIRGDNILVDGVRLPFVNIDQPLTPATTPFANLPGALLTNYPIRGAQPSQFVPQTLGGVVGTVDTRVFPAIDSPTTSPNKLTAADATRILRQAAQQADITRAAIRQPLGSPVRVSITVVDINGTILGNFRTQDAPVFGFDVSAQKARSALFFSRSDAAAQLRADPLLAQYANRAAADGLNLDGSIAFSARGEGFLHRPLFPDGINNTNAGPFSTEIGRWSPFNVGLQLDALSGLRKILGGGPNVPPCTDLRGVTNGFQIFAGGDPVYKNGELVGAIGISGDGIDQDDIIGAAGTQGFEAPAAIRCDQVFVRGVRLPYVKFPRSPNL